MNNLILLWTVRLSLASMVLHLNTCMQVEEKYTIKGNGSGSASLTVNMEGMQDWLGLVEELSPDTIWQELGWEEKIPRLEKVPGVKKVKTINDSLSYRFGVAFQFEDLRALNLAMRTLQTDADSGYVQNNAPYFRRKGKVLDRLPRPIFFGLVGDKIQEDPRLGEVLGRLHYRMEFTFAKPVQALYSFNAPQILDRSQKKMVFDTDFGTLLENESQLHTTFIFSK